ncbi:MAG: hypothetical protein ABIO35_08430 [Nitrobacter sp.]
MTTKHRGVFFGYAKNIDGEVIDLRAARNCIYWGRTTKGFIGLGVTGPIGDSRVGPAADIQLRDITSVVACSDEAVKVWESAPWK